MTTPDTVGGLQLEIYKRLARLQIGTCRCDVKTPVLEYHETSCTYRVAVEINGLVDELCRAARAAVERCDSCDGTGLLHRADGMYVGECHCVHSAHAGGDVRHSTHHVRRGPESLPCYCGAFTDHQIGDEQ